MLKKKKKPQNYWKLFQAEEKNQIQSRDGRTNLFLTSVAQQSYTTHISNTSELDNLRLFSS